MLSGDSRVSELTLDELRAFIRDAVSDILRVESNPDDVRTRQISLLHLPPLSLGAWPSDRPMLNREDFYDDVR